MKDFFGTEIQVGDTVAWSNPEGSFHIGTVSYLGETKMRTVIIDLENGGRRAKVSSQLIVKPLYIYKGLETN